MSIIFILLVLYVFRDYIAFIFLALPLRLFNSRMRIQETKIISKEALGEVNDQSLLHPYQTFVQKIKIRSLSSSSVMSVISFIA